MKIRDAIGQYIAWRQAHGTQFKSGSVLLHCFPGRIFVLTEAPGFQGGSSLGWTSCLSCGTSLLHRGCIGAGTGWSFRR